MSIKVALAGAGAFGIKHLDGIKNIPDVEVISLISRDLDKTREVADKYGIPHVTTDLADSLAIQEVDAVILCTPTQMHASQTRACLEAGKHVQVEIPLCDVYKDGAEGGLVDVLEKVHAGDKAIEPALLQRALDLSLSADSGGPLERLNQRERRIARLVARGLAEQPDPGSPGMFAFAEPGRVLSPPTSTLLAVTPAPAALASFWQ